MAWDTATSSSFFGLIYLGKNAELPTLEPGNDRLANIIISDLSLRQIKHPSTNDIKVITSYATQDVQIFNTLGVGYSYECYVMSGGVKSIRWYVNDNKMGPCGNGGPLRSTSNSALNLNGEDWIATGNDISQSPQGIEMGSHRGIVAGNKIVGTGVTGSPSIGVNIGSTGSGIWDNWITNNYIKDFNGGIEVGNTIGTVNRTFIADNVLSNGGVSIYSGLETNSVVEGAPDTVIHGTSVVSGNTFWYEGRPVTYPIQIGEASNPQAGLESVVVSDNVVTFAKTYIDSGPFVNQECQEDADGPGGTCRVPVGFVALAGPYGGGARWRPSTAYALNDHTVPNVHNGHYYLAITAGTSGATEPVFPTTINSTVTDGTVVWKNFGKRPSVLLVNNQVQAPDNSTGRGTEVDIQNNGYRQTLKIVNLITNYDWRIQQNSSEGFNGYNPALAFYSDREQYSDVKPTAGVFALGAKVNKLTPTAGSYGWVVIRAGQAAPAWLAATAYDYGTFIVPTADNAHYYMQIVGAGCTSGGAQPVWPTGTGQTVNDGTCTWKESGTAVLFDP